MAAYLQRIADQELEQRLGYIGAVLIEGPKACGKTATASRQAQTVIRLDEDETARGWLRLAPERLFDGPTPILFDEWAGRTNDLEQGPASGRRPGRQGPLHPHRISDTH
jgi:hypothetical protein